MQCDSGEGIGNEACREVRLQWDSASVTHREDFLGLSVDFDHVRLNLLQQRVRRGRRRGWARAKGESERFTLKILPVFRALLAANSSAAAVVCVRNSRNENTIKWRVRRATCSANARTAFG